MPVRKKREKSVCEREQERERKRRRSLGGGDSRCRRNRKSKNIVRGSVEELALYRLSLNFDSRSLKMYNIFLKEYVEEIKVVREGE